MHIPKLIENDPWLEPYKEAIIGRLKHAAFKEQQLLIGAKNLSDFASGHEYFGLFRKDDNWLLREWAPNATHIFLIGSFNDWKKTDEYKFKGIGGIWELELPFNAIKNKDLYKIMVEWDGGEGARVPAWARRVVQEEDTKVFNAQVWFPEEEYRWKCNSFKAPTNPIIYESHVGMATEEYKVGTYNEFRTKVLPRIKKSGYNAVQLMAIQEHPYYGSFGYHVSSFFAPSSRFGTPEELKALIDDAHGMGMAVIMDIVHSHAVKNELEGLSCYDGTYYQFFHDGPRGNHDQWDSRCFDYSKRDVLRFLLSNCKYWIEEFKFDGFRFDGVTSMLYFDHGLGRDFDSYERYYDGGQDGDAITYMILANKLIHEVNPDAITIAEDMSGMPGLAAPLDKGGLGFDYRLAMGVPDYWIKMMKHKADEDWHVENIFHELTQNRADEKVIGYAESHDQAMVGDKTIIFWLIDKEMYTDMHVSHQNLVVDRGMALHKIIRLVTMATTGNGYLTFMGNEFGHPEWIDFPREGNDWSYHYARRQWSLSEHPDLRYKFLWAFDRDMIKLMKDEKVYDARYPFCLVKHVADQILVFRRNDVYFVFNFNPTESFTDYGFEVERSGEYKIILNSDNKKYGGFGRVNDRMSYYTQKPDVEYYSPNFLNIYLPARTALAIKRVGR